MLTHGVHKRQAPSQGVFSGDCIHTEKNQTKPFSERGDEFPAFRYQMECVAPALRIGASIYSVYPSLYAYGYDLKYMSQYAEDYREYVKDAMSQHSGSAVADLPAMEASHPMFEFDDVSFLYPNTEGLC